MAEELTSRTFYGAKTIALVMIATACMCGAQPKRTPGKGTILWSPPMIGWIDNPPQPTVPREMIGRLVVAGMPVILEDTTLEEVQKRFGGTIGSRGDAGDSEGWLCFHGNNAEGLWIFWLTSGELDGPAISGFQWRSLSPGERPDRRCRILPTGRGGIDLPLAIQPGMKEAEARQILGQPSYVLGKTMIFSHKHRRVINNVTYTVSNNVAVVLYAKEVQAIEVAKSTSD